MMKFLRFIPLVAALCLFAYEGYSQCNEPFPPGTGPQACNNAPLFCSEADFDGFCSETSNSGVGICPGPFCGSCENYHFMSFIANSTTIQLQITPSNCAGTGMGSGVQAEIYETSDCVQFTSVSNCESPGAATVITITANNLTIGQVYYLMIDGWAGDACQYEINVLQGIGDLPPPVIPGGINGPVQVCPGANVDYFVPAAFGATDYEWTITPAIGSITSGQGTMDVNITWTSPGGAQLCVTPSNSCETGPPVCIPIISTPIPPTFTFLQFCLGETVECEGQTIQLPGTYEVIYESELGCDSVVTCVATAIPPIITPPLQVTLCAPDCFDLGGETYCETGAYPITFQSAQGCDSIVTLFLTVLQADAVIQPPGVLGCGNSGTLTLDGTASTTIPGSSVAELTYEWTGPGVVPPNDQTTVDVNTAGTYTLTVTHELNGVVCTGSTTVTVNEDTAVPDPPTLNGATEVCIGDMNTYNANPAGTGPPPTGYTFTVTGGTFVDNGNSINVTWNTQGTGQVCVTADNDCGPSAQVCLDVEVGDVPVGPALVGPDIVCEGDIITYEVNPVDPNADSYNWQVSGNASFTDNGTSIDVDFSGAVDGQVCVRGQNECGNGPLVCINFSVVELPVTPVIVGDANLCEGETGTYAVAADPNATNYVWTTPNGEPITGQGTAAITVDWTASAGGDVCVIAENSCGGTPEVCFNVIVNPLPTATISGSDAFCTGSGDMVDLTITLTGQTPWDVTYEVDGANPTTITINSSPFILTTDVPGDYTITDVVDASTCVGIASGTGTVTENPLPTANIFTDGSTSICANSTDCVPLSVNLTGTPNWTVTISINGTPQAPVTGITASPYIFDACQGGDFEVVSVTDGNGCTDAGTGLVTIIENTAPVVSNIQAVCNGTNTAYNVIFEIAGGDPASYTVNGSNAGISAGPPYIFTSPLIPSGSGYSFTVTDVNDCNPVVVDDAQVLCNCTSAVGTMDQAQIQICGDNCATAIYNDTNEVLDADDISEFILHTGSGANIVNEIARNNIPEFCFNAGLGMAYGTTYYVSAVVGNNAAGSVNLNDPCAAVAQGTPVVWREEPTAVLSGDFTICEGESADLTVNFTGASPWTIQYSDGTDTETLTGIVSNPYTLTVTPGATTTYALTSVSNNFCPGIASGTGTVTVNFAPTVANISTDCNNTSTAFTVTFEINGGDSGTYEVLPAGSGTITPGTPAVFTSNDIPANSTYSFQVTDGNGCDTVLVETTQPVICNCATEVGEMDLTPIDECGDGPVIAIYDPTLQNLDGNDVVEYILHTNAGTNIGTVLASSPTPAFSFTVGTMTYGTTYYISAIVGNNDGTGGVDVNDPCLAVAPGTPVTFFAVPTATLSGTNEICLGDSINITIALTGDAPYTIVLNDGTNDITLNGINTSNFNYQVSPAVNTTYNLVSVSDENCPGTVSGSAAIDVNEAPVVLGPPSITFNSTNTGYTVCFDITGGEPPYNVFNGNITVTTNDQFCSQELPCGSGFSFEVDDDNGCGPVIVEQATVVCNCTTQVGEMDLNLIEVCGNGPIISTYDPTIEVLDGNDVVDFILHNGNNVPIAVNSVPQFGFSALLTYGTTYFISARAGNNNGSGAVSPSDPCLSISEGTPITFYEIPSALLSGSGDVCIGQCIDLNVTIDGGVAPWTITYATNLGDTVDVLIPTDTFALEVCPTATTIYTLIGVEDANCAGSGTGTSVVTLQGVPFGANIQEIIDPTNTFMTICFDIIGGDTATYVITGNPGTITGTAFCSDPIPCDEGSYFFLVQDGFECITDTVQGPIICECLSNAGFMSQTALTLCEFESVSVDPAINTFLDGNDTLLYALHTSPDEDSLGTIIATNNVAPSFNYNPVTMDCDVTYYISSVVGDHVGGGLVDLTDECLSVAEGTPVQWRCLPSGVISGSATICEGDEAFILFTLSGEGPFNVTLNDGNMDILIEDIDTGDSLILMPTDDITYNLVDIFDVTTGCFNTAGGSVTFTVNTPVDAGTANPQSKFCEGTTTVVNLAGELTGADPGGVWIETSVPASTGGAFNAAAATFNTAGQAPGTYTFSYNLTADAPCPDDSETVIVVIDPLPVADAGDAQEINCDISEVNLGGPNTSIGSDFVYEWVDETNTQVGTASTLDVTEGGTYTLTVTNIATGCASTDQVVVTTALEAPSPAVIQVSDVSCFGDSNGFILIDSISGGAPPYLCSINGADFTTQKQFVNLDPGVYDIVIQDSKGCEFEVSLTVGQPDELVVELIGDFENEEGIMQLGDSLEISVQLSIPTSGVDSIVWSPLNLINCDTCFSNFVSPDFATTFTVWILDENGCTDEDDLRVLVKKDRPVYIANAFSPNGDGDNDVFFIQAGPSIQQVKQFYVFDRWGEVMYQQQNFQPNNEDFGWDGLFRGDRMDPAVFTYFAEIEFIDGVVEIFKGDVVLVR